MKLNCKPGDLAIVVKSMAGNEGKIVRVLKFRGIDVWHHGNDLWETDTTAPGTIAKSNLFRDEWLRPLRDSKEPDETLTWAGKPQEVKA